MITILSHCVQAFHVPKQYIVTSTLISSANVIAVLFTVGVTLSQESFSIHFQNYIKMLYTRHTVLVVSKKWTYMII